MKKMLALLFFISTIYSSLYAYSYDVKDGLQEVDTLHDINDMDVFNNSCVDYVLYKDSGNYKIHVANGVNYNYNGLALESLNNGDKIIIKANGDCIVEISPELEVVTHNGLTYGTVVSPKTGKIWLDRNIGATRICSYSTDANCFGGYYQWGRDTDGHEKDVVSTTTVKKTWINNQDRYFVKGSSDWTTADSSGSLRSTKWSKTDGTSVCPIGYRVPTITELRDEMTYFAPVVDLFLKLPHAGIRYNGNGALDGIGIMGETWSSTPSSSFAYGFSFLGNNAYSSTGDSNRAYGRNVRCIKD